MSHEAFQAMLDGKRVKMKSPEGVLCALIHHCNTKQGYTTFVSNKTLARECGYTERQVQRIIQGWIDKGALEVESAARGPGQPRVLRIALPWLHPEKYGKDDIPRDVTHSTDERVTFESQRVTNSGSKGDIPRDVALTSNVYITNKGNGSPQRLTQKEKSELLKLSEQGILPTSNPGESDHDFVARLAIANQKRIEAMNK